jgi:CDP-diacylglycerol---glycerol-3-phosphate 3-phosphatidyltransferase
MTFTGFIGAVCMFPLRAIIRASVALGIHPNVLTLIGVLINVVAAIALGRHHFLTAAVIMIVANIFDFIDGKVAYITNTVSRFGAFWDSTLDRFSDIALFLGLIYLYATLRRTDYVMVAALGLMFSIMTSYARARAESLIEKCKVGFMERPERIVLFMIGAFPSPIPPFTPRMAAVQWVILILSIVTVANRIHYTYLVLNNKPIPSGSNPITRVFWRAFFWRDERGSLPYDLWVIAILAFIWLTPPDWLRDPTASGMAVWEYLR